MSSPWTENHQNERWLMLLVLVLALLTMVGTVTLFRTPVGAPVAVEVE